jgi:hypothetical protein
MNRPIFVRALTADKDDQLVAGLGSCDAFVLRRCQTLSATRDTIPRRIADEQEMQQLDGAQRLRGLQGEGDRVPGARVIAAAQRPQAFTGDHAERLPPLLHPSPRRLALSPHGSSPSVGQTSLIPRLEAGQGGPWQPIPVGGPRPSTSRVR